MLGHLVESSVPDRNDQLRISCGEGAGEVNGFGAPQGVIPGPLAGLDFDAQVSSTGRVAASSLPRPARPGRGRSRSSRGYVLRRPARLAPRGNKPARHRSITAVPHIDGKVAPLFFDQQFHEGARIEIEEDHALSGADRLPDSASDRRVCGRQRPDAVGRVDTQQSSYRDGWTGLSTN
ncbi:MAG: hypothetical protein QOE15_3422 [Acidimicrobiaceae bacterium]|nr:hypothetical protein [Acidimicrobiaceae bacterium]